MFEKLDWKIALRTGLGAALTWAIDTQLTEAVGWTDRTISGLWAVVSSIFILQSSLGGGYLEGYNRFIGLIVGSLMGVLATSLFGWEPLHLAISLFFTVLLMGLLNLRDSTRIACLSCAVVMVVWSLNPIGSPWIFALHRFTDSCLGLIVGLLTSHFLFPSETKKKLIRNKQQIFSLFSSVLKEGDTEALDKARDLLKEDDLLIKELHAEWTRNQETKDRWESLHNGERTLFSLLDTSTSLPRDHLLPLVDGPLLQTANEALDALDRAFNKIGVGSADFVPLQPLINRLKEERLRYRETRATREFTFQQLEGYFVFFYTLEQLLLETEQLEKAL